jgi:hypothetical protein
MNYFQDMSREDAMQCMKEVLNNFINVQEHQDTPLISRPV